MEKIARNFIEEIVIKDIEEGRTNQVYTRFPPEPNGYLHIGHAKSLCINFGIKEKYNGKCNLRFDDTNPIKEDEEYVNAIKEDIKWLGFEWDKLIFASDYFNVMYDCAEKLITKGLAYVCDLTAEEIRLSRGTLMQPGANSPYRERSAEENLRLFRQMRDGVFADGQKVLRAKIDMSSPNLNMRDPVIYRILHAKHHNTGDKWVVYPMYDFAHPIEDAYEKITHSICTLEFEDHRPLYDWVVRECEFDVKPQQIEFARLNITNTVMSKRFLKRLVDEKKVFGWDDPRMPTLCGLRRRGYPAAAIVDFCERIGVAKANSEVEHSYLESCVRENLNKNCNRIMAVFNPIKVVITNYKGGSEVLSIENNPNEAEVTYRNVTFSDELFIDGSDFMKNPPPKYHRLIPNGYVRLKGAYIIKCDEVVEDEKGNVVQLNCSYVPESKSGEDKSGLKVKGVVQWADAKNCVTFTARKFGSLLIETDADDLFERLNPDSMTLCRGIGEKAVDRFSVGEKFQLMRCGYYVVDKDSSAEELIFNEIVGLKDSFTPKE